MNRGELWRADLAEPQGSAPGGRRPVLIVQDDLLNRSKLRSVMVVPLTSNLLRAQAAGNVLLSSASSGLSPDSVAVVCQVTTVDCTRLTELVGSVPRRSMTLVDAGLRLALGLG